MKIVVISETKRSLCGTLVVTQKLRVCSVDTIITPVSLIYSRGRLFGLKDQRHQPSYCFSNIICRGVHGVWKISWCKECCNFFLRSILFFKIQRQAVIGEAYPSSERTALITKQDEDEHLSPRSKDPRRHCRPCRKKRQVI